METYKIQEENHFLDKGLPELELFKHYSLYQLIKYFDFYEERLITAESLQDPDVIAPVTVTSSLKNDPSTSRFGLKWKHIMWKIKIKDYVYFDRVKGNFVFAKEYESDSTIRVDLHREDFIRELQYPSHYIYIKIPHKFLKNHLSTNIGNPDLQTFYKVFNKVNCNNFTNIVSTFQKNDIKNREKLNPYGRGKAKPNLLGINPNQKMPRYKWRADMFPDMIHSMSKFGYGYPVIIADKNNALLDGSHRMSVAPVVHKDLPVLLNLQQSENYDTGTPIYYITPAWFRSRHLVLEIVRGRKFIGGYLCTVEELSPYINYLPDLGNGSEPINTFYTVNENPEKAISFQKHMKKVQKATGFDIKFEL